MDTSSRVLQPLNNRPDACTERDVVSNVKASQKAGKHTARRACKQLISAPSPPTTIGYAQRPCAAPLLTTSLITHKHFAVTPSSLQAGEAVARFESRGGDSATADPCGRPGQGGRDQAGGQALPAGEAAKQQLVKGQPQSLDMTGQHDAHDAADPSTSLLEQQQDAAAAASPASLSAGDTAADSSGKGADDDAIEDPDFEEAAAATRGRPRRRAQQQSSDDDEDAAAGSESSDEVSDDADADSPAERRPRGRPRREQQVQQAGSGRARRAAAVAAVGRMRGAEAAGEQQEMAVRRSARTTGRAAAAAAEESDEDVPVARPRRAAAAAAKEATAAALAAEAAPLAGAGQPDSDLSDLGSPDASDAEADAAAERGANSSSDDDGMAGSDSEGDLSDDDDLAGSGSWGTGAKRQRSSRAQPSRQQPSRQQPRRGRGGRAVVVDDSDEPSSGAEGGEEEEEGSPEAGAGGQSEEAGDLPLNLDAFRFDGKAAGSKRGAGRRRGSSGDGSSREDSEEPAGAAALAAALQEEEELSRDVLPASEFAPLQAAKLGHGEDVDKCLAVRYEEDDSVSVLVKLLERPYRQAVWLPAAAIEKKRPALLRNFLSRQAGGETDTEWVDTNNINPAWYKIDRIVSKYKAPRSPTQYLVKWCGLEYSECTWETQEEICRDGAGQVALSRFKRWSTPPQMRATQSKRPRQELLDQKLLPAFKNGRNLRDYQEESLHWMVNNYRGQIVLGRWKPRNCILGDEMGLGKTAQSIAVISWLKQYAGASAPCLVVAPLTTLGHWKREIETWTDLNVVLYAGSALDRQIIREREFWYPKAKTCGPRFNVLLSSYETVLKDRSELKKLQFEALIVDEAHRLKNTKSSTRQALQDLSVRWLLMLSGTPVQNNMKELQGLMSLLDHDLYGDPDEFREQYGSNTPTLEQIRALQGALAPVLLRRMKEDVEDLPEKEEVVIWVELTAEQRRYYRALYSQQIGALLGGGSNKNLPSMRNLAMELRKLCCHPFLCDGLEDDMTLKWKAQEAAEGKTQKEREIENYTRASGKMLLLHKLLPKLRAEGRQVLIFSQFKMMLDVIEDYLTACDFPFERIDGDTKQAQRQAAIDRFMAVKDSRQRSKTPTSRATSPSPGAAEGSADEGSGDAAAAAGTSGQQSAGASRAQSPAAGEVDDVDGPFVFLLSTRAGGQGITLTSADTVIIYDSDWNPQNDLQAMARCHRIGQDKEVTVYRLVSKSTYEQQLFECSSRKMGLDEAILGFAGTGDNPENDAARIEQLLRLGAHAIMQGGEEGAAGGGGEAAGEDKGFAAEDIEQILLGRSEKRQLGSRKGNTFSIAHFGDGGGELEPEQEEAAPDAAAAEVAAKDAKTFWAELLPEAAAEHAARAGRKVPEVLGPRRRKAVDYREANMGARAASSSDFTAGDGMEEDGEEGASSKGTKRGAEEDGQQGGSKKAKRRCDEVVMDPKLGRVIEVWKTSHVETVRDALLRYGIDQVDKVVEQCRGMNRHLESRQRDEVVQLCEALLVVIKELSTIGPKLQHEEKAARAAAAAAAAAGDEAAVAAAAALARTNGNLSSQYVNNCRDALLKAGLEAKLPPACSKAVLALANVRAIGRSPAGMLEQMLDHSKVHQAMLKAGLVKASGTSSSASKLPTLASSEEEEQEDQQQAAASAPAKSQPAAAAGAPAAAAAAAAAGGGGVEAAKRVFVVPRVMLRGSKGLPSWWRREQDDMLLQGCYAHGYFTGSKLQGVVETILQDPAFGFTAKIGLDPEALVRDAAEAEALKQPGTVVHVQVTGPDGQTRTQAQLQRPKPEVDAKALAAAQAEKQQLLARHPGIQLVGGADMKNLVVALAQRLKRVRAALCDPNYVEPPTPSKQLHLHNPPAVPGRAAAPPAAAAAGPSAQQRLLMIADSNGSFTHRGKLVIGGGLPAVPAAAPAAGGAAIARQMLANQQQRAVAQQTAANMAAANAVLQAGLQARKRQAEQQLHSAGKRPNASPAGAQQQQQQQQQQLLLTPQEAAAFATGKMIGTALAAGQAIFQAQQAALQRQQQAALQRHQQQRQQPEVVELLDDDDSSDIDAAASPTAPPAAAAARTPAAAGVNPPSSGLLVRRLPAGADLSQEQSVDEPAPGPEGAVADTAAGGVGKQHMQLLLGDPQQPGSSSPRKGTRAPAAGAEHPVYGTPAGAAGAGGGGSTRRKPNKEDPQQRKINAFFASSK